MPAMIGPAEVLDLNRYGLPTKWRPLGVTIPAASAVAITADATGNWTSAFKGTSPAATRTLQVDSGWGIIVGGFNWGHTSKPDQVYHEIWVYGRLTSSQLKEGFFCSGPIGWADEENPGVHPAATTRLEVKLWNMSSPAVDVWVEFAMQYYTFPLTYLQNVLQLAYSSLFGGLGDRMNQVSEQLTTVVQQLNTILEAMGKPPAPAPPPPEPPPEEEKERRHWLELLWNQVTSVLAKMREAQESHTTISRRRRP